MNNKNTYHGGNKEKLKIAPNRIIFKKGSDKIKRILR